MEFCSDYVRDADTIGVPNRIHDLDGGIGDSKVLKYLAAKDLLLGHINFLENMMEVQPYIR